MTTQSTTIEAVSGALETMAFVSAWPFEGPAADAPQDPVLAAISFEGAARGTLELAAPRAFARTLATNLLGSADGEPSDDEAHDALKELMNVACGALLRVRRATESTRFEMSIPWIESLDGADGWAEFTSRPDTIVLDAEGTPIAFRVVEESIG